LFDIWGGGRGRKVSEEVEHHVVMLLKSVWSYRYVLVLSLMTWHII